LFQKEITKYVLGIGTKKTNRKQQASAGKTVNQSNIVNMYQHNTNV
jgi:hypothetical protein